MGASEGLRLRLGRAQIAARLEEVGRAVTADYAGEELVVVGVAPEGVLLLADLVRHVDLPLEVDFLAVRPLEDHSPSGHPVALSKDLEVAVAGRHVLLVDGLVDSGRTVRHLTGVIAQRAPTSVRVAALLDRPQARREAIELVFRGFEIGREIVAGYGISWRDAFRGCPDVWEVADPAAVGTDPWGALARAQRSIEGPAGRT